jgi:hypothetical protein
MQKFKEYLENEYEFDYFIIEVSSKLLEDLELSLESHWQDSSYKGYKYRLDNPENHTQQKHIHIAKSKHIKSKNQQVAWNMDGTRHDKKTFNDKLGQNAKVQVIAREILGIDDNISLESYEISVENGLLNEFLETDNLIVVRIKDMKW